MWHYIHKRKVVFYYIDGGSSMDLYKDIGNRLRKIRGKRTQKKFVKELDLMCGMSRSYYSMIEIGKRPASLKLLDMIAEQEHVSYDYIFGVVDSRINIHDEKYHQILEIWSVASDKEKEQILKYAKKTVIKERKNVNR